MSNEKLNLSLSNDQILQNIRSRQQSEAISSDGPKSRPKFLLCQLNNEVFGLEAAVIQEISRVGLVTRVPNTPNYVLGVINLRGTITAVIDIRAILGLEQRPLQAGGRIVVCEVAGIRAGIVCEGVSEVVDINLNNLEPPLLALGPERAAYSIGIVHLNNRLVVLLNLATILDKLKV